VTQLINQVSECLGSIKGIANTVQKTADFFSDLNIQKLKDTVNNVIESASNKFANITQQNIDYLVYRFCQLSNAVEQFMRSPLSALQNSLQSCTNIKNVLTNASTEFSLSAITAGAFRISDDNVASIKSRLAANLNNRADAGLDQAGNARPAAWHTIPATEAEKAAALAIISASDEQIKSGSHPGSKWFDFSRTTRMDDPYPSAGVKELSEGILVVGMRISDRLGGKKLIINSAYRSERANRDAGGEDNSLHLTGNALDISRRSFGTDFESGENFIKIASQAGAMGIGAYSQPDANFIHIDVRGYRATWTGKQTSGPLAHENALKLHKADQFRIGASPDVDVLNADVRAALGF
jgi:hypothetical protein